jgi:hypothetical protein
VKVRPAKPMKYGGWGLLVYFISLSRRECHD